MAFLSSHYMGPARLRLGQAYHFHALDAWQKSESVHDLWGVGCTAMIKPCQA
jgi:hypothetical protein